MINKLCALNKKQIEDERTNILSEYKVILCTIDTSSKIYTFTKRSINTIIVDEAGAVNEETMLPLIRLNPSNLIIVGDHKQLRAFSDIPTYICNDTQHNMSLLERLVLNKRDVHLLKIQYRMEPSICNLVSNIFYNGELITAPYIKTQPNPLVWIHVEGVETSIGSSYNNIDEVTLIQNLCYKHINDNVVVLSSYSAQFTLLKKMLRIFKTDGSNNLDSDDENKIKVKVNIGARTIDSSQGMESDIVIISLVRSNKNCDIGFMKNLNRLCVMLSRARHQLYIVGNYHTFNSPKHKIWQRISQHFVICDQTNHLISC